MLPLVAMSPIAAEAAPIAILVESLPAILLESETKVSFVAFTPATMACAVVTPAAAATGMAVAVADTVTMTVVTTIGIATSDVV